jgi:hypothetical protein
MNHKTAPFQRTLETMQLAIENLAKRMSAMEAMHRVKKRELQETHDMGHNSEAAMNSFLKEFGTVRRAVHRLEKLVEGKLT